MFEAKVLTQERFAVSHTQVDVLGAEENRSPSRYGPFRSTGSR
ncbi:hypothetical protein WME79_22430 [Sorangium sp. So ce726]